MDDKKSKKPAAEQEFFSELAQFEKSQEKPAPDKPITIAISQDKLTATAFVVPPLDTSEVIDKSKVIDALKQAGVTHGIDEAAIDDIFTYGTFNVEIPVAKGAPPSNGVNASFEYKFSTDPKDKAEVKADDKGNVDFRNVSNVASVEEGALLAVKIPAKPGEKGMDVLGSELPAKDGVDLPLPLGENTLPSEDGMSIIARISGQPILKDKKVAVSAVYEVKGDVNFTSGNIDFKGSVIVRGGVQNGFTVKATDDIEITGNVEKATIIAGGDVRMKGGLYGAPNEGHVKAGGNIEIRSAEGGIIEAGLSIILNQGCRQSVLQAGEDIKVVIPKGSIVAGKATAGRNYDVANLGSPSFTETIIEVGMNPKIKEAFDITTKRLADDKAQLEKIIKTVKTIKEMEKPGHPIPPDKMEMLKRLVPALHQLKADMESNQKKLGFMQDKMKGLSSGKCRVKGVAYPGVKIFTLNASFPINKEIKFSSFYEQNEQIIIGPY